MPQPPTVALVAIAVAAVAAAVAAEAPPAVAPSLLHKPQQTVAVVPSSSSLWAAREHGLEDDSFDWLQLPSSSSFELTPCYGHGTFQCTRFDVPLNWATANEDIGGADADMMVESGDDDEPPTRMQIAVIKLPAKVPVTHPQYGGAVFLNPGGPGESGVEQVLTTGHHVQTILDHPAPPLTPAEVQAWLVAANKNRSAAATAAAPPPLPPGKYFDVYGFDPRGVGVSTPHLPCFAGPVAHAAWRATALLDYAVVWHSDPAIGLHLAAADSLVKSCSAGRRGRAIFRALNTPQVVEDLLAMVEAHGEWREREARRLLLPLLQKADADGPDSAADASADTSDALTRTAWLHGREQLQYWGVSYGTLLGQTFAAMHPDRVARVVIDGVMDPDDYYAGAWRKNLNDADGIMHTLADLCYRAGPERCPLHTGGSGRDVEDRAWKIVQNLKAAPLPVPVSGRVPGTPQQQLLLWPEMVTYGDVTLQILSALAFPHTEAERVFGLLAELEAGNGTALALAKQAVRSAPPPVSPACAAAGDFSDACLADAYVSLSGTMQAIECMDSAGARQARNETAPLPRHELHEYLDFLFAQSRWYAAPWAFHRTACGGVATLQPHWTPLAVPAAAGDDGTRRPRQPVVAAANTSFPLLVIGNSFDTATPLANARRAAFELFPGAALLLHDGPGHCSRASPSRCTAGVLQAYFQHGTLPAPDAACRPDALPFIGPLTSGGGGVGLGGDVNDVGSVTEALEAMARAAAAAGVGVGGGLRAAM